jgi:hypothetical protein
MYITPFIFKVNWQNRMFSQTVGNKLRTCILFKEAFETEMYLSKTIPSRYRSAFVNLGVVWLLSFVCKIFSKSVYSSKMHSLNFAIIQKHQFFFLLTAFLKAHRNTL